MIEIVHEDRES